MRRPKGDGLTTCWAVLVAVSLLSALLICGIGTDMRGRARKQDQAAGELYHALDSSDFFFFPSGRPLRNRLAMSPAVDLRFTPFLPGEKSGPETLIFSE
jgi:hypothetical protein